MASSDDMVEASISFVLVDSLKSCESGGDLSPEDISWVDSCLVKDPDISDGDWSSMKDALLEILGLQPESVNSHHSAAPTTDDFSGETDIEMLHSEKPGIVKFPGRTNGDSAYIQISNEEMERVDDEFPVEEETEYSLPQHSQEDPSGTSFRNPFLPHYRDDSVVGRSINLGQDITSSPTYEVEPLTQDIFKVWDLGIPVEEDLSEQLNKALSETSDQIIPSTIEDSKALKDLKEQSVDELITGLADFSLGRQSD